MEHDIDLISWILHKRKIDNLDPNNVLLVIATNLPVRLMTGFVVQGHILLVCKHNLSQANNVSK